MNALQTIKVKVDADRIGHAQLVHSSEAFSQTSLFISRWLEELQAPSPAFMYLSRPSTAKSIEEQLYDALANFKIRAATIAMHLDRDSRTRLFRQLDNLLDSESWDREDLPPTLASFSTFLRLLILLRPVKRPGIGATHDGHLIAMWTSGTDRLTIECLAGDIVRWNLSVRIDEEVERAAGVTPLPRLSQVLQPYQPAQWFSEHNIPSG